MPPPVDCLSSAHCRLVSDSPTLQQTGCACWRPLSSTSGQRQDSARRVKPEVTHQTGLVTRVPNASRSFPCQPGTPRRGKVDRGPGIARGSGADEASGGLPGPSAFCLTAWTGEAMFDVVTFYVATRSAGAREEREVWRKWTRCLRLQLNQDNWSESSVRKMVPGCWELGRC